MAPPICFTFLIPIYPEANSRATRVSSTQYLRAISAKGGAHRRGIRELRERRLSWLRSGVVEREKRVERRRLLHGLRRGPPETAVVREGLHQERAARQGRASRQYLCVLKCKNVTLGTPAAPPKTIEKKKRGNRRTQLLQEANIFLSLQCYGGRGGIAYLRYLGRNEASPFHSL